jgi:hypothetical protein
MGTAWHVSPLKADSQGAIAQDMLPGSWPRHAAGDGAPGGPRRENVPWSPVVRTGLVGPFRQ